MPAKSIDIVITSPPYWGLRDYGFEQIFGGDKDCEHGWGSSQIEHDALRYRRHNANVGSNKNPEIHPGKEGSGGNYCQKCQAWRGQLGLEPTPEFYIEHLTEIFNEVKRVLKKEGTLWLNIGDTYGGSNTGHVGPSPTKWKNLPRATGKSLQSQINFKPKCLLMIPERLAWSLIQNGWILRNKNIWHKRNAMPSSVTDRFSNTYEFIYMFSHGQKYYFDLDAVREPHQYDGRHDTLYKGGPKDMQIGKHERWPDPAGKNPGDVIEAGAETRTMGAIIGSGGGVKVPGGMGWIGHPKGGGAACQKDLRWCPPEGKNPGDFFEINTRPFPEAHFAVFPEKLCEKPIKAGCPEEVCKKCGKARERIVEVEIDGSFQGEKYKDRQDCKGTKIKEIARGGTAGSRHPADFFKDALSKTRKTIGWTSCNCNAGFEGGIVLDPFCGAGTALYVAKEMKRRYVGIDIKQEYCDMCEKRLAQGVL